MSALPSHPDLSPETLRLIVEEVVRRLVGENSAASQVSAGPTARPNPLVSSTQPPATPPFLSPVLTLKDVIRIPTSQSRLTIPTGCVVTPSARDELRRRNISVDRSSDRAVISAIKTLVVVSDDCAAYEKSLSQALESRGFNLHRLYTNGADRRELLAVAELAAKGFPALVATQNSASWMLQAARVDGLRPIFAVSPEYIARSHALQANVLVCDIVETPASKAASIALAFARGQAARGPITQGGK